MAEINPYEPLLGRVEALALEGYAPATIAKALGVQDKVMPCRGIGARLASEPP